VIKHICGLLETFFALSVFVITGCGTGSETTNSTVRGMVYQPDGTTPAVGAVVCIRPERTLADTAGILSKWAAETGTAITDADGQFFFESTIETGSYIIEADDGTNNRALVGPVTVTNSSTGVNVTAVLRPAGTIKGTIHLTEGGDPRRVFICAFGLNRFTMPHDDGVFIFDSLAEAVYDLRIITVSDDYAVLDTFGVKVISGEDTDLDTLIPSFTGIPTPKRVSLSYDTLKQIVSLVWAENDTSLVWEYRVYRKHADSAFVRIAAVPVNDTFFSDSSLVQDARYEYRITAVDKENNEGEYSNGLSVVAAGEYALVKMIGTRGTGDGQFEEPRGITGDSDYVYIADYVLGKIEKYDIQGRLVDGFTTAFKPFNLLLSRRKNLVICSFSNEIEPQIIRTSTSGVVIDTFELNAAVQEPYDLAQDEDGNFLVANRASHKVVVFNENGDYLETFGGPETENGLFEDIYGIAVDEKGYIYLTDGGNNRIRKLRSDGALDDVFGTDGNSIGDFSRPSDITIDDRCFIYVMEWTGRKLKKFDTNGNLVSRFGTDGSGPGQFGANLNCIWLDYTGRIWISEGANNHRIQIFEPRR
jgi:hypothetical protein